MFSFKCFRKSIFGYERYGHLEQIGDCKIKKLNLIKDHTFFYSPSTGFSMLFAKKEAYDLVINNAVTGLNTRPVYLYESLCDSGLYQLIADTRIETERIYKDETIRVKKCPVCGKQQFVCNSDFQLRLNGSENDMTEDFYMTDAVFGDGIPNPLFIVSKKVYTLLVENKMTSNVVFEPILFMG